MELIILLFFFFLNLSGCKSNKYIYKNKSKNIEKILYLLINYIVINQNKNLSAEIDNKLNNIYTNKSDLNENEKKIMDFLEKNIE